MCKNIKRILSLILSLVMVVSIVPTTFATGLGGDVNLWDPVDESAPVDSNLNLWDPSGSEAPADSNLNLWDPAGESAPAAPDFNLWDPAGESAPIIGGNAPVLMEVSPLIDNMMVLDLSTITRSGNFDQIYIDLPEDIPSGTTAVVHVIADTDTLFRAWLGTGPNSKCDAPEFITPEANATSVNQYAEFVTTDECTAVTLKTGNGGLGTLAGVTPTYVAVYLGSLAEYEQYLALPSYTVTVTNGAANIVSAKEGETVTVTASAPGKTFTGWTVSGVTLTDATAKTISFAMPANNVTLTANYINKHLVTVPLVVNNQSTRVADFEYSNSTKKLGKIYAQDLTTFEKSVLAASDAKLIIQYTLAGNGNNGDDGWWDFIKINSGLPESTTLPRWSGDTDTVITHYHNGNKVGAWNLPFNGNHTVIVDIPKLAAYCDTKWGKSFYEYFGNFATEAQFTGANTEFNLNIDLVGTIVFDDTVALASSERTVPLIVNGKSLTTDFNGNNGSAGWGSVLFKNLTDLEKLVLAAPDAKITMNYTIEDNGVVKSDNTVDYGWLALIQINFGESGAPQVDIRSYDGNLGKMITHTIDGNASNQWSLCNNGEHTVVIDVPALAAYFEAQKNANFYDNFINFAIQTGFPGAANAKTYITSMNLTGTVYAPAYSLTVDGTTTTRAAGEKVTINANIPAGASFDKWTATGVSLTAKQTESGSITITMPANDVSLTSSYGYTVSVNGTVLDDVFAIGESVTIPSRDYVTPYETFDSWSSNNFTLSDAQKASKTLTFDMPAADVALTINDSYAYTEVIPLVINDDSSTGFDVANGKYIFAEITDYDKAILATPGAKLVFKYTIANNGVPKTDGSDGTDYGTWDPLIVNKSTNGQEYLVAWGLPSDTILYHEIGGGDASRWNLNQNGDHYVTIDAAELAAWYSKDGRDFFRDAKNFGINVQLKGDNATVTFKSIEIVADCRFGDSDILVPENKTVPLIVDGKSLTTNFDGNSGSAGHKSILFQNLTNLEKLILAAPDAKITMNYTIEGGNGGDNGWWNLIQINFWKPNDLSIANWDGTKMNPVITHTFNDAASDAGTLNHDGTHTVVIDVPALAKQYRKDKGVDFYDNFINFATQTGFSESVKTYITSMNLTGTVYVPGHTLTVDGTTLDGIYSPGDQIPVSTTIPEGSTFGGWKTNGIHLTGTQNANTSMTFTMPATDVELDGTYYYIPWEYEGVETPYDVLEHSPEHDWNVVDANNSNYDEFIRAMNTEGAKLYVTAKTAGWWWIRMDVPGLDFVIHDKECATKLAEYDDIKEFEFDVDKMFELIEAEAANRNITLPDDYRENLELVLPVDPVNTTSLVFYDAYIITPEMPEAPADPTYSITVINGTASASSAEEGTEITVTANPAEAGKKFTGWTATGISLSDDDKVKTEIKFNMPAGNVELTANYVNVYSITVTNGTASASSAEEGTEITVTANPAEAGKKFTGWTATGISLSDKDKVKTEIKFNMPAGDVELTANYVNAYTVTVNGNELPDKYAAGETVTVTADITNETVCTPVVIWRADNLDDDVLDSTSTELTFTMPESDVAINYDYYLALTESITLTGHLEVPMVELAEGETIDLNGYTLTVTGATVTFSDSHIIDSSEKSTGKLVTTGLFIGNVANAELPVMLDANTYAFVTPVRQQKLNVTNNYDKAELLFLPGFGEISELFADGMEDNGLKVKIVVHYYGENNFMEEIPFACADDLVKRVYDPDTDLAFKFTATGFNRLSSPCIAIVIEGSGVSMEIYRSDQFGGN